MAIVKDKMLLQLMRGALRKQFSVYERNGQVIMAVRRRPSRRKPTEAQLAARHKMKLAAARAKQLLADPELKAYYRLLAGPRQNAYNLALKDAYHDPAIQHIKVAGAEAVVTTKPECPLAEVEVQVIDAKGVTIERGQAIIGRNKTTWHYKAAVIPASGKVVVTAVDWQGLITVKELLLEYAFLSYKPEIRMLLRPKYSQ